MAANITNENALSSIEACFSELNRIAEIIKKEGALAQPVQFLTKYAIIKSCGTIEYCFKTIICDHTSTAHSSQIRNFIDSKIRNSSMNPSFDNICKGLKSFDEQWCEDFKDKIKKHADKARLFTSLSSLNLARNTFAHGKNTSTSFSDVNIYFKDCVTVMELLESSILGIEFEEAKKIDESKNTNDSKLTSDNDFPATSIKTQVKVKKIPQHALQNEVPKSKSSLGAKLISKIFGGM